MKFAWMISLMIPALLTAADLGGTSWQLVKFQGGDKAVLTPDDKTRYSVAFGTDGSTNVRIDCNRGRGAWKSPGPDQLQLGPLALTRMMCPSKPLNDRMAKDWESVRSYALKGGHLFLSGMTAGGTYEFEPVKPKGVASRGPFKFDCTRAAGKGDKEVLTATFYETKPGLLLLTVGRETRPAFQVQSGSGAKYEGEDVMFWEARGEATVTWAGLDLKCKRR